MKHIEQLTKLDGEYSGAMLGIFDPYELSPNKDLDAGSVFIYMFRRFGYPRYGWDDQKTLVKWICTTGMDGVLLEVQPNVTGAGTFGYLLRRNIDKACIEEELKPSQEWNERFETWTIETKDIEIMHLYYEPDQDKLNRVWQAWVKTHEPNNFKSQEDAESVFFDDQAKITQELGDEYEKIEPYPKRVKIDALPNDSILKQCHDALKDAIADLWVPVMLRDVVICIDGKHVRRTEDMEFIKLDTSKTVACCDNIKETNKRRNNYETKGKEQMAYTHQD